MATEDSTCKGATHTNSPGMNHLHLHKYNLEPPTRVLYIMILSDNL
jgi:hypothetical protein